MGNLIQNSTDTKFYGFRIYQILENGPLSKVDSIKEIEDFILPPEGFDKKIEFTKYLAKNSGTKVKLNIYNIRSRSIRSVEIIPGNSWTEDKSKGFLGANVRYENWALAHKNVLRFIEIKRNSIIDNAGIKKNEDYLIAMKRIDSDIVSLNQEDKNPLELFRELLDACNDCEIELIIYNLNNGYRSVHLNLATQGDTLGCDLAYGQLHEFPHDITKISENETTEITDKSGLINN